MADNKSRFMVNAILPDVRDADDRCMERFIDLVSSKRGVDKVHVVENETKSSVDTEPASFCIHFDPEVISVSEVREFAHQVGAELDQRYGHWHQRVAPTHARRASAIESRLARIDGVIEAVVSPDGAVRVEFDRQVTNASTISGTLTDWSTPSPLEGCSRTRGASPRRTRSRGSP